MPEFPTGRRGFKPRLRGLFCTGMRGFQRCLRGCSASILLCLDYDTTF